MRRHQLERDIAAELESHLTLRADGAAGDQL